MRPEAKLIIQSSHSKILGTLLDAVQWIFGPCYRHPGLNFIPLANNIKGIDSESFFTLELLGLVKDVVDPDAFKRSA